MPTIYLHTNSGIIPKKKTNSVALVRKRTIPTEDRRMSAKLVPTFAYIGCRVVSATSPHGR
jgi:hypothetical protein